MPGRSLIFIVFVVVQVVAWREDDVSLTRTGRPCDAVFEQYPAYRDAPGTHVFKALVSVLKAPRDVATDQNARQRVEAVVPFQSVGDFYNPGSQLWDELVHTCVVTEESLDTVLVRIYRYGLLETAGAVRQRRWYDRSDYMLAVDKNGKNLLHLAVESRSVSLVWLLVGILEHHAERLLYERDANQQTPEDLAVGFKPMESALDEVRRVYLGDAPSERTGDTLSYVPITDVHTPQPEHVDVYYRGRILRQRTIQAPVRMSPFPTSRQ